MRSTIRVLFVAAMAVGTVAVVAAPSGAGAPGANTVTIVKHVVGTAPAGTVFAANIDCQSILSPGAALVPSVTFDASGTPLSNNTFNVPAGQTCTVTETASGGASPVGFACSIVRGTPTRPARRSSATANRTTA